VKSLRTLSSSLVLVTALALVAGCGSNSAGPSALELDTTPPPVPASVSVAVDHGTGVYTLSWAPSSAADLASYEVEAAVGSEPFAHAAQVSSSASTWTLPAVETRRRESYRVRAIDTSGNPSGWSQSVEVMRGESGGSPGGDPSSFD
jgi:hypothetical protein